jgi:hypothetical protein
MGSCGGKKSFASDTGVVITLDGTLCQRHKKVPEAGYPGPGDILSREDGNKPLSTFFPETQFGGLYIIESVKKELFCGIIPHTKACRFCKLDTGQGSIFLTCYHARNKWKNV